ncbi:hypothetical protein HGRIS_008442 [Hohenbuehelia grisea]|uniref:(2E,6E)-farnesyl diphosphate synthase n=1 Tax=Hohenbuehelia grisea TaxID=104357 RepID=A0ABR3J8C2_9AGAR
MRQCRLRSLGEPLLANVTRRASQNPNTHVWNRRHSAVAQKLDALPKRVHEHVVAHTQHRKPTVDPYTLLAPQLDALRSNLLGLLGSAHPGLTDIAQYYFLHPSKQIRPLLVLLFSSATNGLGRAWDVKHWATEVEGGGGRTEELDQPLTRPDVLNDWNPTMPDHTRSFDSVFDLQPPPPARQQPPSPPPPLASTSSQASVLPHPQVLLPTQVRLAQIVEMIHVASLLHDDVIDQSPLRRGSASAPTAFGNKLSVLGGDFLLGRASAALARLGEPEVVELISSVIANLVEGEILQMRDVINGSGSGSGAAESLVQEEGLLGKADTCVSPATYKDVGREAWNVYLRKTYLKTASLMAKGARSAVVLGGCRDGDIAKEVAYAYGRNLGIAFQVCHARS